MPVMAKKKPKGRSRERGETVTFTFEMTRDMDAALEACAAQEMRTKKAIVTLALQSYFGQRKLWPPPAPAGEEAAQ